MKVAQALKAAMADSELNQADVARKSGLTQKQISLILLGRVKRPHETTLRALRDAIPGFAERVDAVAA